METPGETTTDHTYRQDLQMLCYGNSFHFCYFLSIVLRNLLMNLEDGSMICMENVYNILQYEFFFLIGSGKSRHSSILVILIILLLTSALKTTAEIFNEI